MNKENGLLTDVIVLYFVRERAVSGYDIRKLIANERVIKWVPVSPVTIYQSLRRLEEYGFVSAAEAREGAYPAKTVYTATPAGISFHDTQVERFLGDGERNGRSFTIGLSCASRLPVPKVVAAMRLRIARLHQHLDYVTDRLDNYRLLGGFMFPEWIHLAREKDLLKAEIAWLEEFAEHYAERK